MLIDDDNLHGEKNEHLIMLLNSKENNSPEQS